MISTTEMGIRISRARTRMGLTQEQLADKIRVTKQAVSNWERGKNGFDIETKDKLEKMLKVDLTHSLKRKEKGSIMVKALDQIDNIDELLGYAELIVEKTPVDGAFASSVKKLLQLVLDVVLGYEIYALSFQRKADERENNENPDLPFPIITTYDWNDVSEDVTSLLDDSDKCLLGQAAYIDNEGDRFLAKTRYMLHAIGSELFEDFDDDGYRDGYIQQIGRIAESEAYNLISLLSKQDNTLVLSFKISLLQMKEIIESLSWKESE